jgi:hypothetical protein
MSKRIVLMNALFDQFQAFIVELCEMYPEDGDFETFLTTIKLMRSTNPSLVPKYIYEHTNQFESQILAKDESFFIDYSFVEYGEHVDLDIFSKLKQYLKTMDEKSKENVWKYVQNIFKLADTLNKLS